MDERLILNPLYINAILQIPGFNKYDSKTGECNFLNLNLHNSFLSQQHILESLKKYQINSDYVKLIIFEFNLILDSITRGINKFYSLGEYTDQTIILKLEELAQYKNAVLLLIKSYEPSTQSLASAKVKTEWEKFNVDIAYIVKDLYPRL